MKYYIISGEASGDLHGANLIKELVKLDPAADIRCWGGDMMEAAGAKVVKHYKELAFMGFKEVIANIGAILSNINFCKKDIIQFNPDVVIFIDYPGFNLRLAKFAKKQRFKTLYYIAPQVWAWKEGRVEIIKKYIDKLLVILPFEVAFFAKHQCPAAFTGHPLLDAVSTFEINTNFHIQYKLDSQIPIIALLPGSRKQEILKMLPIMCETAKNFSHYQFVIAAAPGQTLEFYESILYNYPNIKIVSGQTYQLLKHAYAACVASGTATLETALFNVPQVVCYKGSWFSYQIGRRLVKVKYISLVNLILDKPCVSELIQDGFTTGSLTTELEDILTDNREDMLEDYIELIGMLGNGGASQKAATAVFELATKK